MSTPPPIPCVFTGSAFEPRGAFLKRAREHYGVGEVVALVPHEDRSIASHRHYFAAVNEAWANLPEAAAARFPTADHLRKYALIRAGYRDEKSLVCSSKAEARRMAAFIRPMDDFALVTVSEALVTVLTAKSQSMRAMGKKDFQESKDAVLGLLAQWVGVSRADLVENAGKAA